MYTILFNIRSFCKAEDLGEDFLCEGCKSTHKSVRQFSIKSLPKILCLHLKRFKQTPQDRSKIETYVEFPLILDVAPFLSDRVVRERERKADPQQPQHHPPNPPFKREHYKLFAVVNHIGSIDKGHYVCFISHPPSSLWYKCDDHIITRASLQKVLGSQAYLLFYIKT
eukprot:TRINITY_DN3433_c0_g1_i5.p1 TRINITY_DN3433_c0_g1~~TRINITY_DN3433_c0_g1_i5.p1  ORF type:complete len:168 (+),score=31.78 TRINITY_DN3433_c0_g1_i5:301-804(+)